jgi:predicted alpha/beta-fold hydrolase
MIPAAGGDGGVFAMVSEHLATHYTVLTYDRRGFSRSRLDGPQDYGHRLQTDADDARRLIEHVSDEPATIFGTSSGGIVALTAHADRIVPAAGRESRGHPAYQVSVELGKKLGRDMIEMPGGHVGFVAHPAEFAHEFMRALAR